MWEVRRPGRLLRGKLLMDVTEGRLFPGLEDLGSGGWRFADQHRKPGASASPVQRGFQAKPLVPLPGSGTPAWASEPESPGFGSATPKLSHPTSLPHHPRQQSNKTHPLTGLSRGLEGHAWRAGALTSASPPPTSCAEEETLLRDYNALGSSPHSILLTVL